MTWLRISRSSNLFVEHDLFRKPVSTFRDHALTHLLLRTQALADLLENIRIVLGHDDDLVEFLDREALIGDRLLECVAGLLGNALFVGGSRGGDPLLIILLHACHLLHRGCHLVELLVREVRGLLGGSGSLRLSTCSGWDENKACS